MSKQQKLYKMGKITSNNIPIQTESERVDRDDGFIENGQNILRYRMFHKTLPKSSL